MYLNHNNADYNDTEESFELFGKYPTWIKYDGCPGMMLNWTSQV